MFAVLPWVGSFILTGLAFTGVTKLVGESASAVIHPYQPQGNGININQIAAWGLAAGAVYLAYKKFAK